MYLHTYYIYIYIINHVPWDEHISSCASFAASAAMSAAEAVWLCTPLALKLFNWAVVVVSRVENNGSDKQKNGIPSGNLT
jgi:hypothetical protein